MKLTGKCKIAFDKWLEIEHDSKRMNFPLRDYLLQCYHEFNFHSLPESMQYGVYVDFFDSVEIIIDIKNNWNGAFGYYINHLNHASFTHCVRHEARTAAIEKANEIYNKDN